MSLDLPALRARLDAWKAAKAASTRGPWKADLDVFGHDREAEIVACVADGPNSLLIEIGTGQLSYQKGEPRADGDARWKQARQSQAVNDAAFIVHAHESGIETDLEALLLELEQRRLLTLSAAIDCTAAREELARVKEGKT